MQTNLELMKLTNDNQTPESERKGVINEKNRTPENDCN